MTARTLKTGDVTEVTVDGRTYLVKVLRVPRRCERCRKAVPYVRRRGRWSRWCQKCVPIVKRAAVRIRTRRYRERLAARAAL